MLKRLLLLAAMGVALAACGPGASPTTPAGGESPAATDSVLPSASDMIDVSPSPSQ